MAFFAGTSNIKIVGGEFNDIKGNYRVFDRSRHETNVDSNNMYNNKLIDSYNDNSKRLKGPNKRPRSAHGDRDDDEIDWAPSTSAGGHAGSPPQFPQPMPGQTSFEGGHVVNDNSFNMENTHMNDAFNDYSRTYHYQGRAPPTSQRRRFGPQRDERIIPDVEEDLQSNTGSSGNSRSKAPSSQSKLPQRMATGVRSGPFAMADNSHIRRLDQNMRQKFSKLRKQTQKPVPEQNDAPNTAGNNDEKYESDDAHSSSSHNEAQDPMNTRMADLSIHDPMPSHKPGDGPQLQLATNHSPPPTFSRLKSDPQKPITTRVNQSMGSSSPSNLSPTQSNPSLDTHMKERAAVTFLAQPAPDEIHGNNDSNKLLPVPPSGRGPVFRTIYGDLTKHDTSVHQTNISSFNTENNTIKNSFNDNSLIESSGTFKGAKK